MVSFWVGSWNHNLYSPEEICDGEKCPVIKQLCFGPLESCEYGVDGDGNFYFENKILEGINEGDSYFEILDKEKILDMLKNELWLCKKHSPQFFEQVTELFNGICSKFGIEMR